VVEVITDAGRAQNVACAREFAAIGELWGAVPATRPMAFHALLPIFTHGPKIHSL
jgi:hypothetical protein